MYSLGLNKTWGDSLKKIKFKRKRKEVKSCQTKIRTRFDSSEPNKNKIATLVGHGKDMMSYKDFLDLKVEHNGVEQPLHRLLSTVFDKMDDDQKTIKRLIGEQAILSTQLNCIKKLYQLWIKDSIC